MRMTLFVDASYDHSHGTGGWGAWAKTSLWDKGRFFGGEFSTTMHSSSDAEIAGISNALYSMVAQDWLGNLRLIQVQCDNVFVLSLMMKYLDGVKNAPHAKSAPIHAFMDKKKKGISEVQRKALDRMIKFQAVYPQIDFEVRHVKGHDKGSSGRSWVNQNCDRIARKHMRDARRVARSPRLAPPEPIVETAVVNDHSSSLQDNEGAQHG